MRDPAIIIEEQKDPAFEGRWEEIDIREYETVAEAKREAALIVLWPHLRLSVCVRAGDTPTPRYHSASCDCKGAPDLG